jgi:general stress protein CsbA
MRKAYRVLADVIAVGVAVQSMAMVWAIAGLFAWIDDGGTLNQKVLDGWDDNPPDFQGAVGFAIHGTIGMMVIPVLALALLAVAFFADVPGAVKWAGLVLILVVIQVAAGLAGEDAPWLGLVHGLDAFALFAGALFAARAAHPQPQTAVGVTP